MIKINLNLRFFFFLVLTACFFVKNSRGQLIIYQGAQQTGTSATCVVRTIYSGVSIPAGLDNQITSIKLTKGFMATLAENAEGSGNSYPFIAVTSDLNIDLNTNLNDRVSFIRVLPLANTLKKGAGYKSPDADPTNNTVADQLNVSWLYDWGANDISTATREYSLMAWGRLAANSTNVTNYIAKTDVTHLLSFNEPDNASQSNISVTDAVLLHKNLEATGYRLGSPAPEEQNAQTGRWLGDFMVSTQANNIRVDYVAIHWYDWGSYTQTFNTAPNANDVFTRFKNYVNNIYNIYKKPIWITEFNANRNTTSATHVNFINLALPWLEQQDFVERYAYFFPPALTPVDVNGNLTAIGTAYSNFNSSTLAIKSNQDGTPDILSLEAEDAAITGTTLPTVNNCINASGGKIVTALTGDQKIIFSNVFVASTANYKLKFYYFSKNTATGVTSKINTNSASTTALPGTTNWCFESGANAGTMEITVALTAGNNTIEITNAPIIDKIEIIKMPPSTLPIRLTNFSVDVKDYGIKLNWQTAQEVNNQYFELLKAEDKNEFKTIANVKGAGNSTSPNSYSFTDFNPFTGINYYQLKQVDIDGKSETFNPIAVKFGLVNNELSLLGTSEFAVTISISSENTTEGIVSYLGLDGRLIYREKVNLKRGLNSVEIPVNKSTGLIGIVNLSLDEEQKSLKILR